MSGGSSSSREIGVVERDEGDVGRDVERRARGSEQRPERELDARGDRARSVAVPRSSSRSDASWPSSRLQREPSISDSSKARPWRATRRLECSAPLDAARLSQRAGEQADPPVAVIRRGGRRAARSRRRCRGSPFRRPASGSALSKKMHGIAAATDDLVEQRAGRSRRSRAAARRRGGRSASAAPRPRRRRPGSSPSASPGSRPARARPGRPCSAAGVERARDVRHDEADRDASAAIRSERARCEGWKFELVRGLAGRRPASGRTARRARSGRATPSTRRRRHARRRRRA